MKVLKGIGYWFVSLTWGLPMTLLGALIAIALLITGHKPKRFHYNVYFEVGERWGGLEAGGFFFVNRHASQYIKQHEAGHGLQNLMLGMFMPFVICIPSAIRYLYRKYLLRSGKKRFYELPDYDSIWFEGWATRLGRKYFS